MESGRTLPVPSVDNSARRASYAGCGPLRGTDRAPERACHGLRPLWWSCTPHTEPTRMLTYEQAKVLGHLRRQGTSRQGEPAEKCLPVVSTDWPRRVLADLEWLGYVVVFWDRAG